MNYLFFLPEKNEIDSNIHLIAYYAILIYIISLFSQYIPVVTNVTMGLLFLLSLILLFKKGSGALIKKNKVLLGIVLFYFIQFISVLFSTNKKDGFNLLSDTVPFFLLAISFLFIEFKQITWNKLIRFFAVATTVASIAGFGAGLYYMGQTHDSGFLYNDNICLILGKQAVYFAFYVGISILIYIYQLNNKEIQRSAWTYLAIAWLFMILFLLASRAAMFSLLLILSVYTGGTLLHRKKYMEVTILGLGLIIGSVVLIKLFPKTLNRFKGTTETEYQFDNKNMENHFNADFDKNKWNSSNTRAAIWACALEVWRAQPILGTGVGDKKDELKKKFEEKKFWFALHTNKNTHNQYLDVLMSLGLTGLLIFILCYFIYPLWIFIKQKQGFAIMVFLLLALCLITENMFGRYQGIVLIALILPLASKIEAAKLEKAAEEEEDTYRQKW